MTQHAVGVAEDLSSDRLIPREAEIEFRECLVDLPGPNRHYDAKADVRLDYVIGDPFTTDDVRGVKEQPEADGWDFARDIGSSGLESDELQGDGVWWFSMRRDGVRLTVRFRPEGTMRLWVVGRCKGPFRPGDGAYYEDQSGPLEIEGSVPIDDKPIELAPGRFLP